MVTGNAGLSILPMLRKIPTWSVSAFGWIFERNELLIYEQPGREALCRDYHADNMAGEDSRVHQDSAEGGYTWRTVEYPVHRKPFWANDNRNADARSYVCPF